MTEITADDVRQFIEGVKPKNKIQSVKKALTKIARGLQFVNTIKNDLPNKDDNQLSAAIKMVGLVSNLLSRIPDKEDGAMMRISKAFKLKEAYNPGLLDIINDFNLLSEFKKVEIPKVDGESFADRYGKVLLYSHRNVGVIGLRETLSEVSSYILHSKEFNVDSIWDLVWSKVDGCVDVQPSPQQYKTFRFSEYSTDEGQQFGSAKQSIGEFIEKNRRFISLGFERSYLFLGPAGSGKTTMSQRFARTYSQRILQFSPDVVWQVGDIDLARLIQESKAEVILIDEIDKLLFNMNTHGQGQLLSRIEKIRKCRPGLITIFTANSVRNFPEAMLRPGRIDDIIEFTYPGNEDRQAILRGYSKIMGVDVNDDVVNQIAGMSEGLTGAWLKEVVLQMKVSDPTTACNLIEKMLKYAKSKNDD
jgi:uncharacterized protein (DUF2267 family)